MRFDERAESYDAHAAPQKRFAEALAAFAPFRRGARVTELGAGTGFRAGARELELDPWQARHVATAALAAANAWPHAAEHLPIAYTGRGDQSSSAIKGGVKKFLNDAGITDRTVSASSPTKWRALHIKKQRGVTPAMKVSGHQDAETFARWLFI